MEGGKIIEDLLEECSKITIPGQVDTIAYLSSVEAGLDVRIKNLKLSRKLSEEETLKFLDIFLSRFSKEVGAEVITKAIRKTIEPGGILKFHYQLGYFILLLFFISLITFNFWIGLFSLFLLGLVGCFGIKLISLCPKEGVEILRSYCMPLSTVTFIFWIGTLFLIWKDFFEFAILSGGIAFLCFAIIQFWSGRKVKKTQEDLKKLILAKI